MQRIELQHINENIRLHNEQILRDYPIQDDTWPSRRWKADFSDYADLSGEIGGE